MKELLINLDFKERYHSYFIGNPTGILPYWTEVHVDLRWKDETIIKGVRGVTGIGLSIHQENGILFRGDITTPEELETILKQTKAIKK